MKSSRSKWTRLGRCFESGFRSILLLLVGAYRTIGTTLLGGSCRFEPSCSQYAVDALLTHSPYQGSKLIIKRVLKCRPGGPYGFDPVPVSRRKRTHDTSE